eukprot:CAMPEP_0197415938 /NCGR_PEP_ID=MMETSP1170-20131217/2356_1 /TAXON_ID=54406 /ORGANISM="Sarcinochrysis sp, Strain CCMP770" /LENGTH=405 /DNA_ID=CAMNT_0042942793 /DNA_START=76 /DNA_END=1293 /DNA_ORIENTATION=-
MTDGGDGGNDGTVARAADTTAESATENSGELLDSVIETGLLICEGLEVLCEAGEALPVVGDACKVARGILTKVRTYKENADDVHAVGRRVVKLLKIIQKFQNQAAKLDGDDDRKFVDDAIGALYGLLKDMKDSVDAFVDRGFILGFLSVEGERKKLSKLDEAIGKEMQDIRDILFVDMLTEVKALRAEIDSMLVQRDSASPDSTTTPDDQTLLLQVFEVVMREYNGKDEEKKGVDELCRILHGIHLPIDKNSLADPEFFGFRIKTLCTPLHVACALGKYQLAICLAAQGFDVNSKDAACRLPFHYAARHGHKKIVEWIIKLHKRKRFHEGTTTKSLQELLQAEGKDGLNARDLAMLAGKDGIVLMLTTLLTQLGLSQTVNATPSDKLSSALVRRNANGASPSSSK